jgi:hypothetical protein
VTEFILHKAGNTEAQQKKAMAFLLSQASAGLAATGVLTGLGVTQTGTASADVLVAAGSGVSQDTVGNGASVLVNDTQKTLDILTANPMGATPRNDIVVFDSATTSISNIVGTPNAVPTDPTVPSTAIPLARLRHAASATTVPTAKIDSLITKTSLFGGANESNVIRGVPFAGASTTKAAKKIHWGTYSGTTNASSELVITHACGFTPTVVVPFNSAISSNKAVSAYSITSTQVTIAWRTSAGAMLPSTAVSIFAFFGE